MARGRVEEGFNRNKNFMEHRNEQKPLYVHSPVDFLRFPAVTIDGSHGFRQAGSSNGSQREEDAEDFGPESGVSDGCTMQKNLDFTGNTWEKTIWTPQDFTLCSTYSSVESLELP